MKKYKKIIYLVIFLISCKLIAYSGGVGSASDPYQIANSSDLKELMASPLDWNKNFIQTANIILKNDTVGIKPIGEKNKPFEGNYDGQNHKICDLRINLPNRNNVGLFGMAFSQEESSISNLILENLEITGKLHVGGLVGYLESGAKIINCTTAGTVKGENFHIGGLVGWSSKGSQIIKSASYCSVLGENKNIGGLVGSSHGEILNSDYVGNVSGKDNVGGLVGYNLGFITNSHSSGNVRGQNRIGGLVGSQSQSVIRDSYSESNISSTGNYGAGGLVGISSKSIISNSYAKGAVSGAKAVGGLVGSQDQDSTVNCYSEGFVTGKEQVGGFVGYQQDNTIKNSYSLSSVEGKGNYGAGGFTGVSSRSIITDSYSKGNVNGNNHVGGFGGTIDNDSKLINCSASGFGSKGNSYVGGLVGNLGLGSKIEGCFATCLVVGSGSNIGGLVGYSLGSIIKSYSKGKVKGEEYIGGLVGKQLKGNINGSFSTSEVYSVGKTGAGGLIGFAANLDLRESYATGKVRGNSNIGGLVGELQKGTIINSYATSSVISRTKENLRTGGLVGFSYQSTISNSYAMGNVSGGRYVGGLIGVQVNGRVSKCYSKGAVLGRSCNGGLIGFASDSDSISDCYWNKDNSNENTICGKIGVGKTTKEMENVETYKNWDFPNIWHIDMVNNANEGYPSLAFQELSHYINYKPVFTSSPIITVIANEAYLYKIATSDLDGDSLKITAMEKPNWLVFRDNGDGTAELAGQTTVLGNYKVKLKVDDSREISLQEFTISVGVALDNAPIFVSAPITTALVGEEYLYGPVTFDADKDSLIISVEEKPEWLFFRDKGNGIASLVGVPSAIGNYKVKLRVSAGEATVVQEFTIVVESVLNNSLSFISTPITQITVGEDYSYDIEASNLANDSLIITAEEKPEWLFFIDKGNGIAKLGGSPNEVGSYKVKLKMSAGDLIAIQEFTIVVEPKLNSAPIFTSTPLASVMIGEDYVYGIAAYDADGDSLSFIVEQLPNWLRLIDYGNGVAKLSGTPTSLGTFEIELKVYDGKSTPASYASHPSTREELGKSRASALQRFTITVDPIPNTAPNFVSIPIVDGIVGENYSYSIVANDVDGDSLTITAEEKPDWLVFSNHGNTAGLEGVAEDSGDYKIKLKVTDGKAAVIQKFTITIVKDANNTPAFISTPVMLGVASENYLYNIMANDIDGDSLIITAEKKPDWLMFADNGDGSAKLAGIADTEGSFVIKLQVADGKEITVQEFKIVIEAALNTAPSFVSTPIITGVKGKKYFYNIVANDVDGDPLKIITIEKPNWLKFVDNRNGTAKLTGTPRKVGSYQIKLKVVGGEESSVQEFTLVVDPTLNSMPSFSSDPLRVAVLGRNYSYDIVATDIDGDSLKITAEKKPDWLNFIDNGNGSARLSGIAAAEGNFGTKLQVFDGKETTVQEFEIVVSATPNNSPYFTSSPIITGTVGVGDSYNIVATDIDNDSLKITAEEKPTWLEFVDYGNGRARLTGIPVAAGNYDVKLKVDDGKAATTQEFTIVIKPALNNAPIFTSIPVTKGQIDKKYIYEIVANDIDGDSLLITAEKKPAWLSFTDDGDGTAKLEGIAPSLGSFMINLTVTDTRYEASRVSNHQEFILVIENPNSELSSPTLENEKAPSSSALYTKNLNPLDSLASVKFYNADAGEVKLSICNAQSEKILVIFDSMIDKGEQEVLFDARNFSKGVYYYKLETKNKTIVQKMNFIK